MKKNGYRNTINGFIDTFDIWHPLYWWCFRRNSGIFMKIEKEQMKILFLVLGSWAVGVVSFMITLKIMGCRC